jgi:hypothetical protein
VAGKELAAMIDKGAANQRSGVLGSLNMVADAFKLLPKESETTRRWNTVEWAKERKGWVFINRKTKISSLARKETDNDLGIVCFNSLKIGANG